MNTQQHQCATNTPQTAQSATQADTPKLFLNVEMNDSLRNYSELSRREIWHTGELEVLRDPFDPHPCVKEGESLH